MGSANGDRYEASSSKPSLIPPRDKRRLPDGRPLPVLLRLSSSHFHFHRQLTGCRAIPGKREDMSKSYVIEVGDDQAGLIVREEGEREYLFHAALDAYSALEGRRFANPFLAERAATAHASSRMRRRRRTLSGAGAS